MPGPQIAMQRAHEGTAAPGLEEVDGLESSLLQIASGSMAQFIHLVILPLYATVCGWN